MESIRDLVSIDIEKLTNGLKINIIDNIFNKLDIQNGFVTGLWQNVQSQTNNIFAMGKIKYGNS